MNKIKVWLIFNNTVFFAFYHILIVISFLRPTSLCNFSYYHVHNQLSANIREQIFCLHIPKNLLFVSLYNHKKKPSLLNINSLFCFFKKILSYSLEKITHRYLLKFSEFLLSSFILRLPVNNTETSIFLFLKFFIELKIVLKFF